MSPGMHPALAALRVIEDGLDDLAEAHLWSLLDGESLAVLAAAHRASARISALVLRATREAETRRAAISAGSPSLRAWLVNGPPHLHPGEATRQIRLGAALDQDLPATATALAAGTITAAAAAVIAETDTELAAFATAAQRADAEALLAEQGSVLPLRGLTNAAIHLAHRLDPDRGERLAKDEQAQAARREFALRANPDGSSRPSGFLDKESTAILRAALDPLAKPRPAADGTPDPRTPAQRGGDALIELVELALRSGDLPTQAGQPVQVVVTIALSDLQDQTTQNPHASRAGSSGVGAGTLSDGTPLSVEAVRRWACDCQLIPVVLGGHGEPLDVGRAARTPPPAMRRALDVRDGGCAFPGCDRGPKWARAHHIWHWTNGGPTGLHNLVLLCGHHHKVVHHDGWDVHIETDGLPSFYPPRWIDPDRTPRRNHRLQPHPPSRRNRAGPADNPDHDTNAAILTFPQRN
jgi:Domain of unknown function (DUF222)